MAQVLLENKSAVTSDKSAYPNKEAQRECSWNQETWICVMRV